MSRRRTTSWWTQISFIVSVWTHLQAVYMKWCCLRLNLFIYTHEDIPLTSSQSADKQEATDKTRFIQVQKDPLTSSSAGSALVLVWVCSGSGSETLSSDILSGSGLYIWSWFRCSSIKPILLTGTCSNFHFLRNRGVCFRGPGSAGTRSRLKPVLLFYYYLFCCLLFCFVTSCVLLVLSSCSEETESAVSFYVLQLCRTKSENIKPLWMFTDKCWSTQHNDTTTQHNNTTEQHNNTTQQHNSYSWF